MIDISRGMFKMACAVGLLAGMGFAGEASAEMRCRGLSSASGYFQLPGFAFDASRTPKHGVIKEFTHEVPDIDVTCTGSLDDWPEITTLGTAVLLGGSGLRVYPDMEDVFFDRAHERFPQVGFMAEFISRDGQVVKLRQHNGSDTYTVVKLHGKPVDGGTHLAPGGTIRVRFIKLVDGPISNTVTMPISYISYKGISGGLDPTNPKQSILWNDYVTITANSVSFQPRNKPTCALSTPSIPFNFGFQQMHLLPESGLVEIRTGSIRLDCSGGQEEQDYENEFFMTLRDVNDPANTSATLSLSNSSDARGVAASIYYNGQPLQMSATGIDRPYYVGNMGNGTMVIPLEAQLWRTGDALVAGRFESQARFEISYY